MAVTASAGYESEENYKRLEARDQDAYIKPQNYERSKTCQYRNNAYLRDNISHDPDMDTYTCRIGNAFTRQYEKMNKKQIRVKPLLPCTNAPAAKIVRKKYCVPRPRVNRQMQVSSDSLALRQTSLERITSDLG